MGFINNGENREIINYQQSSSISQLINRGIKFQPDEELHKCTAPETQEITGQDGQSQRYVHIFRYQATHQATLCRRFSMYSSFEKGCPISGFQQDVLMNNL